MAAPKATAGADSPRNDSEGMSRLTVHFTAPSDSFSACSKPLEVWISTIPSLITGREIASPATLVCQATVPSEVLSA
ncbi:hypothetical protein D3C73_1454220 [compost metagenome]